MKTTPERFWSKVNKTNTCWFWTGYTHPKRGHGRFYLQHTPNVIVAAHRYSYELYFGPITKHDYVDQTCGNITCVNPAHLQLRQRNPGEEIRFWDKVVKLTGERGNCWVWNAARDQNGYGLFRLDGHGKQVRATHYSWLLNTGRPVPKGHTICVCHTCDNPACVRPDHLFLGTTQDNTADRDAKGRQSQGQKHPRSKLTESDVQIIRESKRGHSELGRRFGVSPQTIFKIRKGTIWKSTLVKTKPDLV